MEDLGKVAGSEIDKVKNRLKEQREASRKEFEDRCTIDKNNSL